MSIANLVPLRFFSSGSVSVVKEKVARVRIISRII